jgi:hypothetical protein
MDTAPVVRLDALWPELAEVRRPYEVVLTVPREDDGTPLTPTVLPEGVTGVWSAASVIVSVTVLASGPASAVAAAEVLVPDLARAPGAEVRVRQSGPHPIP